MDDTKAHRPFSQREDMNREVAAIRSPILDMSDPEWPSLADGTDRPTPLNWIIETGYETLPLLINPYARNFFLSKFLGRSLPYPSGVQNDLSRAPEHVCRVLGFIGKGYVDANDRITKMRDYVRTIKNKDGSYRISMAVASPALGDLLSSTYKVYDHSTFAFQDMKGDRDTNLHEIEQQSVRNAWKLLGKDSLDPAKTVDIRVPVADFFQEGPQANVQLIQDIVTEATKENPTFEITLPTEFGFSAAEIKNALEYLKKSITSVRLMGSPTSNRGNLEARKYKTDKEGQSFSVTARNEEEALEALNNGHKDVFTDFYMRVQSFRTWVLYIEFDVPAWVQTCIFGMGKTSRPVSPADMATFMQQWFHYMESGQNTWLYRRMGDIADHNAALMKAGVQPKPRTSADGLTVHPDWLILWIPESLPTLEEYLKRIDLNTTATGEFSFNDPAKMNIHRHPDDYTEEQILETAVQGLPANRLIYIDWLNNKLSYTNTNGVETILDLERCMPGRPFHIRTVLDLPLYGEGSKSESVEVVLEAISAFMTFAMKHKGFNPATHFSEALTTDDYEKIHRVCEAGYSEAMDLLSNGNFREALTAIFGNSFQSYRYMGIEEKEQFGWIEDNFSSVHLYELQPDSKIPFFGAFGKLLLELMKQIDPVEYVDHASYSVIKEMQHLAVWKITHDFLQKYTAVVAEDKEIRAKYLNPKKPDPDYVPEGFTLVDENLSFQPHQARIADELSSSPQFALIDVKAGGGKTIQYLTNIAFEMNKRHVKRPLVLCPKGLIKDYITESNRVFAGRFNMIVVNTESLNSWGEDKLLKLVLGAPPNTIVVSDFDYFLKGRQQDVFYGGMEYTISLNCELLRMMDFDGVWIDEVHILRNDSDRTISTQRLLAEIPLKRAGSGTLVSLQFTDLVNEIAMFDPTIFGSKTRFLNQYAARMTGGRVAAWKPGAEQEINRAIAQHVLVLRASRKEWAALLPDRIERFHEVPLSPGQRALYESVLERTLETIKKDKPEIYQKLMANRRGSSEEEDTELEKLMAPYLARMEIFLGAPGEDPDANMLSEEDKISPKGKKMVEIIQEHLDKKIPGKILVFCSNDKVARALFNQMPAALQKQAIHFTASQSIKCIQQFKVDDTKKVMIGIENSMRLGENLQVASRLIRIQAVWAPGDLEQGESRINRPNLNKGTGSDVRTHVYFDHIIVNRTIDVTKTARLIANMVSMVKFENPYERKYQDLPSPEVVSMSLESLMAVNDFNETLSLHMETFGQMRKIQEEEYAQWRNDPKTPKVFKPVKSAPAPAGSGLLKRVPYTSGFQLYGGAELGLVSYYEYVQSNNVDDAVGLPIHTEWGDGTISRDNKTTLRVELNNGEKVTVEKLSAFIIGRSETSTKNIRAQLLKMIGMKALDPKDVEASPITPVVGLSKGDTAEDSELLNVASQDSEPKEIPYKLMFAVEGINVWQLGASKPRYYLLTKASDPFKIKNGQYEVRVYKDGEEWLWIDAENKDKHGTADTSKAATLKGLAYLKGLAKGEVEEEDEDADQVDEQQDDELIEDNPKVKGPIPPKSKIKGEFYLTLGVVNGEYMLSYDDKDPEAIAEHLEHYGFKVWNRQPTWFIEIRRAAQLRSLIEQMEEKFDVPRPYMQQLADALKLFSQGKQRLLHPNAAFTNEFKLFLRTRMKPSTNPNEIKPYVYIAEDGGAAELSIIVDAKTPAASKLKTRIKVPGATWYKDTDPWAALITPNRRQIREVIEKMMEDGIKVANLDEVKEQYNLLNPQKRKHTDLEE